MIALAKDLHRHFCPSLVVVSGPEETSPRLFWLLASTMNHCGAQASILVKLQIIARKEHVEALVTCVWFYVSERRRSASDLQTFAHNFDLKIH
jgi:hypothetical protein